MLRLSVVFHYELFTGGKRTKLSQASLFAWRFFIPKNGGRDVPVQSARAKIIERGPQGSPLNPMQAPKPLAVIHTIF
jgi:hypothetical protein